MKGKRKVTWRLPEETVKGLRHIAVDREVPDEKIAELAINRYLKHLQRKKEEGAARS